MRTDTAPQPVSTPLAVLRGLLDPPLAPYYLLLASVRPLRLIGLVMVFSVTGIDAYATTGNAFSVILGQVSSAVVGLAAFWLCQRLPSQVFQRLAGPLLVGAYLLMVFVDFMTFLAASRTPPG